MRILALVGVIAGLSLPLAATAQEVVADSTQVHVVRPGDTLWDLARQYLSDPYRWPDIFTINRGTVADPHWIYPQARLLIPGAGRLAGTGAAVGEPAADARTMNVARAGRTAIAGRTVFFAGEREAARQRSAVRQTTPAEVPVVPVGRYLAAGLLVPDADIDAIGRLVEVISPTVVDRASPPQIQPYDRVNMVVTEAVAAGDRVQLLRPGRLVEPYGRIFQPTGSARVLSVDAGVATVEVDEFYDRVEPGDIAVARPEFEARYGASPVPATGLDGEILALAEPQPVVSTEDVAFVNLGAASGVVEGDEYVAYLPATQVDWGERPEVEVARLQVVRVSNLTSAVRVLSLEQPALVEGLPVRLVARMVGNDG